jgi:tRNA nucleotidyltransferase/poly(A) polymerase
MNFKTFLVGGAVRDELLGLPAKDLDYVVLAPSFAAMRESLLEQGCKIFVEKPEYLTIRAKHPTLGCVDFACARRDGNYTDGRRPDDTFVTTDLKEDLARRDFTCNAIARDVETFEVVDTFSGTADIHNRLLRAVGSAEARFNEDKLRAFRAVRLATTKNFKIHGEVYRAINGLKLHQFDNVSTERIREELVKAFRADGETAFLLLSENFPVLWEVIRARGIWFRPTTESL